MRPDVAIAEVAARQHGVFRRCQALDAGLTPKMILQRRRSGRWETPRTALYGIPGVPDTFERRTMIAVLGLGGLALASHRTAAFLSRLLDRPPTTIDVSIGHGGHYRRRRGERVHQVDVLDDADACAIDGIPVTTVTRTVIDLAARLAPRQHAATLDKALLKEMTTIADLRACIERAGATRAGMGRLRQLLDDREFGVPESELERGFLDLVERYRLPEPVRQHRPNVKNRVDFAYPDLGIVIEVDGRIWHGSAEAFQADPRRQNELILGGSFVLRFTWDDVTKASSYVDRTIRRAIAVRTSESRKSL